MGIWQGEQHFLKLLLAEIVSPFALQYKVAMFMANVHTCLNGHQTADYFDCEPPGLAAWLAGTAC